MDNRPNWDSEPKSGRRQGFGEWADSSDTIGRTIAGSRPEVRPMSDSRAYAILQASLECHTANAARRRGIWFSVLVPVVPAGVAAVVAGLMFVWLHPPIATVAPHSVTTARASSSRTGNIASREAGARLSTAVSLARAHSSVAGSLAHPRLSVMGGGGVHRADKHAASRLTLSIHRRESIARYSRCRQKVELVVNPEIANALEGIQTATVDESVRDVVDQQGSTTFASDLRMPPIDYVLDEGALTAVTVTVRTVDSSVKGFATCSSMSMNAAGGLTNHLASVAYDGARDQLTSSVTDISHDGDILALTVTTNPDGQTTTKDIER